MNGKLWLAPLLALLLLGSAQGQSDAYYEVEGVEYYMAVGVLGSGNLSNGLDYNAENGIPFDGCAIVKLRPDLKHGRIRVLGDLGEVTLDVEWSDFQGPEQGMAQNVDVDGSRLAGVTEFPRVPATIAGWGNSQYTIWGQYMKDPATGNDYLQSSFFVTNTGFRNEDGTIQAKDGGPYVPGEEAKLEKGDWELHVRIQSQGGPKPDTLTDSYIRPAQVTPGVDSYFAPTDLYSETFGFSSTYYGGVGTVQFDSEALAQAGENRFNVTIRSPDGFIRDSFEVFPAVGNPDGNEVSFDLDQFGAWSVQVTGEVANSNYDLAITQSPPDDFDLNFVWEEVTFGSYAQQSRADCETDIGSESEMVSAMVARAPPPGYKYVATVAAIASVLAGLTTLLALTVLTVTMIRRKQMASGD